MVVLDRRRRSPRRSRATVLATAGITAVAIASCTSSVALPAARPAVRASATTVPATTTTTTPPPPMPPAVAAGPLVGPGDGQWMPAGRPVGGASAVYTTLLHNGGQPIAAAWLDTSRLRIALYAGTTEPAGVWSNDGAVPPTLQADLVAAFNSGFQLKESQGGWYADGQMAVPLRAGAASLVIRTDGSATVGIWGRDVGVAPDVVAVRQNLDPLVDAGQPTVEALTANPKAWGDPLHENDLTWRSALGVDAAGHLIYVAGPAILPADLARAMVALGAQRAMELDINPEWISFDSFTGAPPALTGTKLLADMYFSTTHFLAPFWRDFIAVFARSG